MRRWLYPAVSLWIGSAVLAALLCISGPVDAARKGDLVKEQRTRTLRDNPDAARKIQEVLRRRPELVNQINYTGVATKQIKSITGLRPRDPRQVKAKLSLQKLRPRSARPVLAEDLPSSWDLRKNIGSEAIRIRNQQSCGSCWAFGTVAALEANYLFHFYGSNPDASEQYIVNCARDTDGNAMGCDGGLPERAAQLLQDSGTPTRADDPYTAAALDCSTVANLRKAYQAVHWGFVEDMDETTGFVPGGSAAVVLSIKKAIKEHGAVVVGYRVGEAFQLSKITSEDEVFNIPENAPDGSTAANHAIALIGWDDDKQAWLIKNSWDTNWGASGFMWVRYGLNQIGQYALWVDAQGTSTVGPTPPTPTPPPPTPPTPTPPPVPVDPDMDRLSQLVRDRLSWYRDNYPQFLPR